MQFVTDLIELHSHVGHEAGDGLSISMGQFCDYFRAADAEIASLTIAFGPRDCGFDSVEAKGVPPDVVLSQLIAFIHRTEWSPNIAPTRLSWPPRGCTSTATGTPGYW